MAIQSSSRLTRFLFFSLACAGLVIVIYLLMPSKHHLNGLLVDLELQGPEPARYSRLAEVFTQRLPSEAEGLRHSRVTLDYIHFTELKHEITQRVDFIVLSPQGTPWYQYEPAALERAKEFVRQAVTARGVPVLGICGGHQFLALTFGGAVDFIDPAFAGTRPERYPKAALREQGVTILRTLEDDPILHKVASHPGNFRTVQSHYEEVKVVPPQFVNLAASALSEIQLMRMQGRLVYGFAFHPERCWDDGDCSGPPVVEGKQLLANFLTMVSERGRQ